ncbi:hypothetical protein B9Z65_3609 [Elsinoe australis]|uniref:Uncharacterized protein n=1 Tax=Elsinoe australis TaxID=40998 RepID=A0A2P8AFP0_9PEZI|nr:hypothetical protein B9Z65_3609 [Elsinoe australis]
MDTPENAAMEGTASPGAQEGAVEHASTSTDPQQTSSVPDLGSSILNRTTTNPSKSPMTSSDPLPDHLDILRHAQARLMRQGEVDPVIKQEFSSEPSLNDVPSRRRILIDLTRVDDPVEISEDEDERAQTTADRLPRPRKRASGEFEADSIGESASDTDKPTTKRPRTKAPSSAKTFKKKGAAGKGGGKKIAMTNHAPTVSDVLSSNLFSDIAFLDDAPDLPEIGQDALRAGDAQERFLANLPDNVTRKSGLADSRMLNRAVNVFGKDNISSADNGEWKVKGMRSTLRPHQVMGAAFMLMREKEAIEKTKKKEPTPSGGILGDQMGLGKTVMSLALIVRGKWRDNESAKPGERTTLIVGNAALVNQWHDEINVHCNTDDRRCGVGMYKKYRSRDETRKNAIRELAKYEILLTSYEEVSKSYPLQEPPPEIVDYDERQAWWEEHFEKHKGHLHSMHFKRIILDEAHLIRTPDTRKSRACRALTGKYRWALTGTPMTNGVWDVWALFNFIKLPNLESFELFKDKYTRKATEGAKKELNAVLGKAMLRRSHADRLFGAKIVSLPQASQCRLVVHFNPVEKEVYQIIKDAFGRRLNRMVLTKDVFHRNNSAYAMFTRLRQLTAHPLLVQSTMLDLLERKDLTRLEKAICNSQELLDKKTGKKLILRIRALLKTAYKAKKDYQKNKVDTEKDAPAGSDTEGGENQDTGDRYGLNYKFTRYLTKIKEQTKKLELEAIKKCGYCKKTSTDPHVTSCMHVYCEECLKEMQHEAAMEGEPNATCCVKGCGAVYGFTDPCDKTFNRMIAMGKTVGKTASGKKKTQDLPKGITSWLEESGDMIPSAKTLAIKTQVLAWLKDFPESKIIIYTLWTGMIRVLENMCDIEDWKCIKYYGQMTHEARAKAIEKFQQDEDTRIMICSLKCGGLGLNLTMASKVICVDPWFNNAVEEQAFARCYRITQTQETHLLQLTVSGTVDERMEEIKANKQVNIDVFSNERGLRELSQREIMSLFGEVVENEEGNLRVDVDDDDEDEDEEMADAEVNEPED